MLYDLGAGLGEAPGRVQCGPAKSRPALWGESKAALGTPGQCLGQCLGQCWGAQT